MRSYFCAKTSTMVLTSMHKYGTLDVKVRNRNTVYTPLSQVKTDTI